MKLAALLRERVSPAFTLDVELDVSFDPTAPVAALFGPSGCGKSTTLALIAGLRRPDAGHLVVGERTLFDRSARIDVRPELRRVGFVPQDALLFPHMSVEGNLRFADRRAREAERASFARVCDVLELGPLLARAPRGLSGGERQRVALGRALLGAPRLLLLDEPVSSLDEHARWRALGFVERIVAEFAIPTLYVSHSRTEVLRLARSVTRLDAGRVAEAGAPSDVLRAGPAAGATWNLLRVVGAAGDGREGRAARLGAAALTLPRPITDGREVWCRVSSSAITLTSAAADVAQSPTSARNHLPGTVVHLQDEAGLVRAVVDAGTALQVDVTPEAARELALRPGSAVVCEFKALAIELLGPTLARA